MVPPYLGEYLEYIGNYRMHICPQEIMMIIGAIDTLRPGLGLIKHWCKSCVNGTHKSCEDHARDTQLLTNELLHERTI